ncbi:MAG TPA: phosphatase PAP2 family protein [Conexibacter sp.]
MSGPVFSDRREAALGVAVYSVYLAVRHVAVTRRGKGVALANAHATVALERRLRIGIEPAIQRALVRRGRMIVLADIAYVTLNVGLTVGWLAMLHGRRDPAYHRMRTAATIATLGAQPLHLLRPTAPPRSLDGFIDTILERGVDLDGSPLARLYNPLAAMPSIHVAYAVVIGAAISETARSPIARAIAPAYPPLVAGIVLVTANHFVLDVIAGAMLGAGSLRLARMLSERADGERVNAGVERAPLGGTEPFQGTGPEVSCERL